MTSYGPVRIRPTLFGFLALAALPSVALLQPSANDPDLAALTWIAACITVAFGFIFPVLSIRSAHVDEVGPVADGDAGSIAAVPLQLSGRVAGLEISAGQRESGWYRVVPPIATEMGIRPVRRGVRSSFTVTMRTAAPFGLLIASRDVTVALSRSWHVGPQRQPNEQSPRPTSVEAADASVRVTPAGDSVRSIRAYVPGDAAHLVHWPSTARTGVPMVRELEQPDTERVIIVVDLGTDNSVDHSEAVEAAVRRADGLARKAMQRGSEVTLVTAEGTTPVTARCRNTQDLRRRLAAATPGRLAVPHNGRLTIELVTP